MRQIVVPGLAMLVSAPVLVGCGPPLSDNATVLGEPSPGYMELAEAPPTAALVPAPAGAAGGLYPDYLREQYPAFAANGFVSVAEQPVSTFAADVDTTAYARIRRSLIAGVLPPVDMVRIEEMVNYFDYTYPMPRRPDQPIAVATSVMQTPWNADTRLVQVGLQGYAESEASRPPLNLVFLVDVSGSMEAPDKLGLLQRALDELIDELRPEDTVAMVTYASGVGVALEPTSGRDHGAIRRALRSLSAGGRTNGEGGLQMAYDLAERNYDPQAVNRVILATDGDFNVGMFDPQALGRFIRERRGDGIYLTVLGFGTGNLNDRILQSLAQNGNGIAAYIDSVPEAQRVLTEQTAQALVPIADDVRIRVEFNPAEVLDYRLIGYETRRISRQEFLDDRTDAGDMSSGHSVTALYEITPAPVRTGALSSHEGEIGYVTVRYRLPGGGGVREQAEPITWRQGVAAMADDEARFAAAVAGFGLLLRGDDTVGPGFGFDDVALLARTSRGNDLYGRRGEFVQLAQTAHGLAAGRPLVGEGLRYNSGLVRR